MSVDAAISAQGPVGVVAVGVVFDSAIEDAIRQWVIAGSGLDAAHVLWAHQTGARPLDGQPWASLRLLSARPVAAFDPVEDRTDLTRGAGQEIELRVTGLRELPVRVTFFGPHTVGTATAFTQALATQASLGLPSVRNRLAAYGLSPFDNGTVANVPALSGPKFESRTTLDLRFYMNATVSEFAGYIGTVVTRDYMGPPQSGTADAIDI